MITVQRVREILGYKANDVPEENIERLLEVVGCALEEYGNEVYSQTLKEVVEAEK
jgi:hypothetical protein